MKNVLFTSHSGKLDACFLCTQSAFQIRCLGFGVGRFASSIHSSSALMKLQVPKIMHESGCENVARKLKQEWKVTAGTNLTKPCTSIITVPSRNHLFEGRTRRDIA